MVQLAILKYTKQPSLEAHYTMLIQLFFQLVVDSVNLNLSQEQITQNIGIIRCLQYFKADKVRNQQFFSSVVFRILTIVIDNLASLKCERYQVAVQYMLGLRTDISQKIKEFMRLAFVDKLGENISVGKYFAFCKQKISELGIEDLEIELLASGVDALTLKV